jgi:N-acyl-D-aspartate/D-glutamate deacylase
MSATPRTAPTESRPTRSNRRRALALRRARVGAAVLALVLAATASSTAWGQRVDADVLLSGGTLHDGSGSEGVVGDVAWRGERIVAVGEFQPGKVGCTVDCRGLVVAPGFIDLHTHTDGTILKEETRNNLNYLTQGCTTVVTGNCGGGPVDVGELLDKIDAQGAGTNILHLVPHGSVRRRVMNSANRPPTPDELTRMKRLVDRGMREGACGMSTGLIYVPGIFAQTDELVELAKVVASHGGLYVSHIRDEGDKLLEAIAEAIEIGRRADVHVHVSHFKSCGVPNWGRIRDAVRLIEEARSEGLVVTADQYPYVATSTSLVDTLMRATEIPGGRNDLFKRMDADRELEQAVRKVIAGALSKTRKIVIVSCKKHPQWAGKSLKQIAGDEGVEVIDLVLRVQRDGGASVVNFSLCEEDVRYTMTVPWVATASDGSARFPDPQACPHPRNFGTFPRKIGHYARDEKVLSLAQAIRSATGLPADVLGLTDRGYLRPDAYADVVVFDPEVFIDRATFADPQQYSTGVRYLFVAGNLALEDGAPAPELFGRALRHPVTKGRR